MKPSWPGPSFEERLADTDLTQLLRFRAHAHPVGALNRYLEAIYVEARRRGYHFDWRKLGRGRRGGRIPESSGQLAFEWAHLLKKLKTRHPGLFQELLTLQRPMAHPLFRIVPGPVQGWERARSPTSACS